MADFNYGCLMWRFPIANWNEVLNLIAKEDIYSQPGYGLEQDPHITLLYGFVQPARDVERKILAQRIKQSTSNWSSLHVYSYNIDCFDTAEEYDVLKFNISYQPQLWSYRSQLENNFKYETSYPDYKPHATIAYLNKGQATKYMGQLNQPLRVKLNHLDYSYPDSSSDKQLLSWSIKNS